MTKVRIVRLSVQRESYNFKTRDHVVDTNMVGGVILKLGMFTDSEILVDSSSSELVKWHICEINDDTIGSKKARNSRFSRKFT